MTIGERLKQIRKGTGLTQAEFGEKIGLKSTIIGQMESNQRNITERTYILLREKYNVNIDFLLYGTGEMFIEPANFSLDEYAKSHELRESEINLIRGFMELDKNTRNSLYDTFNRAFANEMRAAPTSINNELASTMEDLEEVYKKNILKSASKPGQSASNITDGREKKEA